MKEPSLIWNIVQMVMFSLVLQRTSIQSCGEPRTVRELVFSKVILELFSSLIQRVSWQWEGAWRTRRYQVPSFGLYGLLLQHLGGKYWKVCENHQIPCSRSFNCCQRGRSIPVPCYTVLCWNRRMILNTEMEITFSANCLYMTCLWEWKIWKILSWCSKVCVLPRRISSLLFGLLSTNTLFLGK